MTIYLIRLFFLLAVGFFANCGLNPSSPVLLRENDTASSVTPDSERVVFLIETISQRRVRISIQNVSGETIFCPFMPARDGGTTAENFPFISERWNERIREFVIDGPSPHFAPMLSPIRPQQSVGLGTFVMDKGDYRLRFSYLIDEEIVQRINSSHPASRSTPEKLRQTASYIEAISPSFKVE